MDEMEFEEMLKAAKEEEVERQAYFAAQGSGTDPGPCPSDYDNGEIPDCGRPPRPYWYGV